MVDQERDRLVKAEEAPLGDGSLVGSFFHGDVDHQWQGCVVAEPHPGYYLIETFSWLTGSPYNQRLVHVSQMCDWSFYDDAQWMMSVSDSVRAGWERAAAGSGKSMSSIR